MVAFIDTRSIRVRSIALRPTRASPAPRSSSSEPARRARRRRPGPGPRHGHRGPGGRRRGRCGRPRVGARAALLAVVRAGRPGRREAAAPRPAGRAPTPRRTPPATTGSSSYLAPLAEALATQAGRRDPLRPPGRRRRPRRPRPAGRRRPRRGAVQRPRRRPRGPRRADRRGRDRRLRHVGHARTRSAATATPPSARPSTPTGSSTASPTSRCPRPRQRYAGKHVAVAGRGASAQNALVALARLAERTPAPASPGWSAATTPSRRSAAATTTSSSSAARWAPAPAGPWPTVRSPP